jgi:hypothetical protein
MFIDELERQGVPKIERTIRQGFYTWFRNHVSAHTLRFWALFLQILIYLCFMWQIMRLSYTNEEEVDDDLFSLACGPDFRVRKYSSCIVNGVMFNTVDRDKNKETQNSGVMSQCTHNGQVTDFLWNLKRDNSVRL